MLYSSPYIVVYSILLYSTHSVPVCCTDSGTDRGAGPARFTFYCTFYCFTDLCCRSGADSTDGTHGTDGTASASPMDVGTASASLLVRDCFLVCMSELLAGICGSVRRPKDDPSRQNLR